MAESKWMTDPNTQAKSATYLIHKDGPPSAPRQQSEGWHPHYDQGATQDKAAITTTHTKCYSYENSMQAGY